MERDCIHKLYPIDVVETVYEAQFKLKQKKIQTILYNEFSSAGQITLETKTQEQPYEFQQIMDLKSVSVH